MKFVALALALLLAVGSQAASLQADAPSDLEHLRAAAGLYVENLKESVKNVMSVLDDTEYSAHKAAIIQRLDDMHAQLKLVHSQVSPMTDSVYATLFTATANMRESINSDIEALKAEIEPKQTELKNVLEKHFQEYYAQMEPIMKEYTSRHSAEMETLRTKLEPAMEELRTKVATNVEETKQALMPIVESVRAKLVERAEALKEMLAPYMEEYKDQVKQAFDKAQGFNPDEMVALKEKIAPLAEDLKVKLQAIFETIAATITKN